MPTIHNFEGQPVVIPGVKSTIKSGVKNTPLALSYGNVLVIDTGSGATYGGGESKKIYEFDNMVDFRNHVKGGLWYELAKPLFRPAGVGVNGISKIFFARAIAGTKSSLILNFNEDASESSSSVSASSSSSSDSPYNISLKTKDEGIIGGGSLIAGVLKKGYGVEIVQSSITVTKYVMKFYVGTYAGLDTLGNPYGYSEQYSSPKLVCQSTEFNTLGELLTWMGSDLGFSEHFEIDTFSVNENYSLTQDDLLTITPFIAGTEAYNDTHLNAILENAVDLDINFVLCDKYGTSDAQSSQNQRIVEWSVKESRFKPEVYIAAGSADTEFAFSQQTAVSYNNDHVTVVHGGAEVVLKPSKVQKPAIYKAACMLGREAGVAPQISLAFKQLDIAGEVHQLNDKNTVIALKAGLLVSRFDDGSFDIVKGVNSLQDNLYLVNEDGTTHLKQIRRIARQLNKEIIVNATRFLKKNGGLNRNTLSPTDIEKWLEGYLITKIATPQSDNLILNFQDISVVREGDLYRGNYAFTPNSEINFLFFTGFILDV